MSSSRFFWISLLRWGGGIVIIIALVTEMMYPSSFGILPSFRLWKLVFNCIVLIGWIVAFGFFLKKRSPIFSSQATSFRQLLIVNVTGFVGILLLISMDALTDGRPLDAAIQFGLSTGFLFGIIPIIQIFMYWRRYRRAK